MRPKMLILIILALSAAGITPEVLAQTNPPQAPAVESKPIGKVATAKGVVSVIHAEAVVVQANVPANGEPGQAKVGDAVYKGDSVQTGVDSAVGIVFNDGTAFNLSANTRMVLDEFVYDPKGSSNSTLFSVARGSFTFITGKVAETGNMKVNTPVATMGIRGTSPHVEILDNGTVKFSTLIEEGNKEGNGGTPRRRADATTPVEGQARQANNGASTDQSSMDQATKKLNLDFNNRHTICRGC